MAATAIFCYWLIIPLAIWGMLRWRGSIAGYTLTELLCVYGYSLAIFILCSVSMNLSFIQSHNYSVNFDIYNQLNVT